MNNLALNPLALGNPNTRTTSHSPQKFLFWYDSIIDLLLVEPQLKYKEIAARLGRTPTTISYIMTSDVFKARYSQRRDQQNLVLNQQVNGKLSEVAILSLDILKETLEKKRSAVPLPDLADLADKTLERLGFNAGAKGGGVNVQINNGAPAPAQAASKSALEEARGLLRTVEAKHLELKPLSPTGVDGTAITPAGAVGEPDGV